MAEGEPWKNREAEGGANGATRSNVAPPGHSRTVTLRSRGTSSGAEDTWQPSWTVASILTGLLSFMLEETPTRGSIDTSVAVKRTLAGRSHAFNLTDPLFVGAAPPPPPPPGERALVVLTRAIYPDGRWDAVGSLRPRRALSHRRRRYPSRQVRHPVAVHATKLANGLGHEPGPEPRIGPRAQLDVDLAVSGRAGDGHRRRGGHRGGRRAAAHTALAVGGSGLRRRSRGRGDMVAVFVDMMD